MIVRRCLCTATPSRPWLFVGMGNPGEKYDGTRHNVGFEMIDAFAESAGISVDRILFKALFGRGVVGDAGVFLVKPQKYMNLSGESKMSLRSFSYLWTLGVHRTGRASCSFYKMPLNRVVVFHDVMDFPCGVLRIQDKGSHGRHNGYISWTNVHLHALVILLVRWMDPKAFLLQKFNAAGRDCIDVALQEGVGALKLLLSKGLTETARCFNRKQKYKHIRVQTMPV